MKKVFTEPMEDSHTVTLKTLGKSFRISSKRIFQNYVYDEHTPEYAAYEALLTILINQGVNCEATDFNFFKAVLALRNEEAVCEPILVLIEAKSAKYTRELQQLKESEDIAPKPDETTSLLGNTSKASATCCSATLKTGIAATALFTVGGILTAASTLVYLNHPSVAFLIALHAPQAVVIATAVVGALLVAYGLYVAIRMLCAAKATKQPEDKAITSKVASVLSQSGYSSFSGKNDVSNNLTLDTQDDDEFDQSNCSMSRIFSSCFSS